MSKCYNFGLPQGWLSGFDSVLYHTSVLLGSWVHALCCPYRGSVLFIVAAAASYSKELNLPSLPQKSAFWLGSSDQKSCFLSAVPEN